MFKVIDSLIDRITMYRLVLYYLIVLLLVAVGLSFMGDLHYNPLAIIVSSLILVASCWIINKVFAYILNAPTNSESSLITALILALIITPSFDQLNILFLLAASGLAIASKYILTIRRKHLFNPAAVAVVLTALGPRQSASWWVGTAVMLPFVVLGGLLITRKIRREKMVAAFFVSTAIATAVFSFLSRSNVLVDLNHMVFSSAIFFLGFVMLTEPLTSPPTEDKQLWYATLVGVLLPPQVHIFSFYSSPELALIAGNIFSYVVSPKTKLFPVLKEKIKIAANSADFVFYPEAKFSYQPGQYMEFTLDHDKTDSRGSRRYFTLASSPTEPELRIGVKFYDHGSSFKEAMLDMDQNTRIVAAQVAGDFTLPHDKSQKLAFIAGGIGITPFRSMAKYLADTNDQRSAVLLYSARTRADIAYRPIFEEARQKIGLKTIYILSGEKQAVPDRYSVSGTNITADIVRREIPDYAERIFYLSGTHAMVAAMQDILSGLGVQASHIKTDFFPGYA